MSDNIRTDTLRRVLMTVDAMDDDRLVTQAAYVATLEQLARDVAQRLEAGRSVLERQKAARIADAARWAADGE